MNRIVGILCLCLALNIIVATGKDIWRNKPCLIQTPTDKLLGWYSYRQQLIYNDYKTYRCF
jgi:hypothetical protein